MLLFNRDHNILFFRISSDIIPFASHPVLTVDWQNHFKETLHDIGTFIKENNMRISMHPDQFIVLNSKREDVVHRSIKELVYHADFLNALGLDASAKIQLHVGGVYEDKQNSLNRFVTHFDLLPENVKKRLVIENDEKSYTVHDCLKISSHISLPILVDVLHHQINHQHPSINHVVQMAAKTWDSTDGIPMIDYSTQEKNERTGKHSTHINIADFSDFLNQVLEIDVDIMLEIKDKEKSALKAIAFAKNDSRFVKLT
jgi:UV DNA damage endonuclease